MHTEDEFITVDEAAELIGCSHWTIRRWLDAGKLERYKSGPKRTVVRRSELTELMKPKKAGTPVHPSREVAR